MPLAVDSLSDDPDQLHAMLVAMSAERDQAQAEIDELQLLISELQRIYFGRRSEQRDPDQMQLGLEDQEQTDGENEAAEEATDTKQQTRQRAKPKRNRGQLPKHLPRIERIIKPEEKTCPCCTG